MRFLYFPDEGKKLTKKFLKFGVLPSQNLPTKSYLSSSKKEIPRPVRSVVQEFVPTKAHSYYQNLQDVKNRVGKLVLKEWSITITANSVSLTKYQCPYLLPKFEVIIDESLAYTISVFKWYLPDDHFLYKDFKRTVRVVTVSDLLRNLERSHICKGHRQDFLTGKSIRHAIPLDNNPEEATEKDQPFITNDYLRARDCNLLIPGDGDQCSLCKIQNDSQSQQQKRSRAKDLVPAKTKAPVSLTSAKRLKLSLQAQRLQCRQLQSRVKEMEVEIEKNSLEIKTDLSHDLLTVISENRQSMSPFMKLFWEQQQRNASRSPTGHRYHPMIIRWCLSIASKSASAYDELRGTFKGSGVIELPSRRQLRDYTNAIKPQTGFNPEVVDTLARMVSEYNQVERYVSILFDEMKIQGGLVWDKSSGELIGYVNLGDPDVNYATFEDQDSIATHALVFMVKGICSKLQYVLGYFATAGITGCQLFPIFWRAVALLEIRCNLFVVATTADGATANRRLFKMHEEMCDLNHDNDKDVIYKVLNMYATDRYIYFFSDAPHLLKTCRNCLFHSGSGRHSRLMWNNGKELLWTHISSAFHQDQQNGLHLMPRLSMEHIELNSYSVMRVGLAAQVLSKTVSSVLRKFFGENSNATADFCENVNKFFDCFNVRSPKEGELRRNPDLAPYTSDTDYRFRWLEDDFLGYLKDWQESIQKREGNYDDSAKAKMFISWQTYEGLKISIYSLIGVTKFLLANGAEYVLTNKLCQDPVEEYFGRQRAIGRRCDNPSMREFGYNDNKLRIQRSILSLQGNTKGRKKDHNETRWYEVDNNSLPRRKRQK